MSGAPIDIEKISGGSGESTASADDALRAKNKPRGFEHITKSRIVTGAAERINKSRTLTETSAELTAIGSQLKGAGSRINKAVEKKPLSPVQRERKEQQRADYRERLEDKKIVAETRKAEYQGENYRNKTIEAKKRNVGDLFGGGKMSDPNSYFSMGGSGNFLGGSGQQKDSGFDGNLMNMN